MTLSLQASTLPWLGGTYRTRGTGFASGALAFEVTGLQATAVPLASIVPTSAPGCTLLTNALSTRLLLPTAGSATTQLAVPTDKPARSGAAHADVAARTGGRRRHGHRQRQ